MPPAEGASDSDLGDTVKKALAPLRSEQAAVGGLCPTSGRERGEASQWESDIPSSYPLNWFSGLLTIAHASLQLNYLSELELLLL